MKIVNIFGLSIVLAVAWTASANNLFDGFGLVQTAAELIDPADHPALVEELLDTILGNPAFSPLRNLTELLKNVAVGDVPALVLDVVDVACDAVMALGLGVPLLGFEANADNVGFVLKSGDSDVRAPMSRAEEIWESEQFREDWPVAFVVHGFLLDMDVSEPEIYTDFTTDLRCRGGYNIVLVDLGDRLDTFYAWAAYNTKLIGQSMGSALAKLVKKHGYKGEIHLFGHSLGAQICAAAGVQYKEETNELLPRITGMEPAKPCFYANGGPLISLTKDHATFVDIVHTNAFALGVGDPVGHVDYYVNGLVSVQPGCFSVLCSHNRAFQYEFETWVPGQEDNFEALKCQSSKAIDANTCTADPIRFGCGVPQTAQGVYYVQAEAKSLFGPFAKQGFVPVCAA